MSSFDGPRDERSWRLLKLEARQQVLRLVRDGAQLDAKRIARTVLRATKELSAAQASDLRMPLEEEVRDYLLSLFQSRAKPSSGDRSS